LYSNTYFLSDRLWRPRAARVNDVVEVVAHGDKQVEKQFPTSFAVHVAAAALLHLGLHGAAALEGLAAPDDERQVMSAQAAVRVGRVCVTVLSAAEDGADVDAGLQPLLPQREPLELFEPVALRDTVHDRVTEYVLTDAREVHGRLDSRRCLG